MLSVMVTVDGTPTPIKAPKNNHEDYFNRKHFYSYVIMPFIGANESCKDAVTRCCRTEYRDWLLYLGHQNT